MVCLQITVLEYEKIQETVLEVTTVVNMVCILYNFTRKFNFWDPQNTDSFLEKIFTGRPSSNRSSTADVNSIPPLEMNVPIPSYPESNLTETNYDLPPPPDNLHDAHSQSTASIEVIFYKLN